LPCAVGRVAGIQHRFVDARGRRRLADDVAHGVGDARRVVADRQRSAAFLFALPAGALADVLDRRRVVLASQTWQLLVAAALGVLTFAQVTTPAILLAMTFALAAGSAIGLPAFGAMTAEVVLPEQLPAALSLNSVALTGSQAVGPALGGLL